MKRLLVALLLLAGCDGESPLEPRPRLKTCSSPADILIQRQPLAENEELFLMIRTEYDAEKVSRRLRRDYLLGAVEVFTLSNIIRVVTKSAYIPSLRCEPEIQFIQQAGTPQPPP
jgi:hypothetical protein